MTPLLVVGTQVREVVAGLREEGSMSRGESL